MFVSYIRDSRYDDPTGERNRFVVRSKPTDYKSAWLLSSFYGRVLPRTIRGLPELSYSRRGSLQALSYRPNNPQAVGRQYPGRSLPLIARSDGYIIMGNLLKRYDEIGKDERESAYERQTLRNEREFTFGEGLPEEEPDKTLEEYLENLQVFGKAGDEDWY